MASACPIKIEKSGVASGSVAMCDDMVRRIQVAPEVLAAMHPDVAVAYCQLLTRMVDVLGAVSVAASSSGTSLTVASSVGSSVSWKRRKRAAARTDRLKAGFDLEDGYCYLRLVRLEYREAARVKLGKLPALSAVLYSPVEWFISVESLLQFSLVDTGSRQYHVAIGSCGYPCDVAFSAVNRVMQYAPGAYGSLFTLSAVHGVSVVSAWPVGVARGMVNVIAERLDLVSDDQEYFANAGVVSRASALLDSQGKLKLRSLEALGDSVLTLLVARGNYWRGGTVQEYQQLRSQKTNNSYLAGKFSASPYFQHFECVDRVTAAGTKVSADALEALLGMVFLQFGIDGSSKIAIDLGLFP